MVNSVKKTFEAVAFDLDGTLYPNYRLNVRLVPFLLKHWKLLWAFGTARDRMRAEQEQASEAGLETGGHFYERQAEIVTEILHAPPPSAGIIKEKIERLIYRGWEPLFKKIKLFPHVRETLAALRGNGYKLGMLSDFPLGTKLDNLELCGIWDAALSSETCGALKPDSRPFAALAAALAVPPEKILYVGNSRRYDAAGAKNAGMATALICRAGRVGANKKQNAQTPPPDPSTPDFAFSDYRQLLKYVLN